MNRLGNHAYIKNFHGRHRRRGPRDGWNGLLTKILRLFVKNGCLTARMIAKYFNITKRAVLYHLKKLLKFGFIRRIGKLYSPSTIYVYIRSKVRNDVVERFGLGGVEGFVFGLLCCFGGLDVGGVVGLSGLSYSCVSRALRKLENMNLVISCGGRRCPYKVYVVNPDPENIHLKHRHKYVKRHRYHVGLSAFVKP